jgi:hypothetical protein
VSYYDKHSIVCGLNTNLLDECDCDATPTTEPTRLGKWLDEVENRNMMPFDDGVAIRDEEKAKLIAGLRAFDEMHAPKLDMSEIEWCACTYSYPCPSRVKVKKAVGL